jgi:hypothetical protein
MCLQYGHLNADAPQDAHLQFLVFLMSERKTALSAFMPKFANTPIGFPQAREFNP